MRRFLVIGGVAGFVPVFLASLSSSSNLNLAVRDGMVGCVIMAVLFRILYSQLEAGMVVVARKELERRQAEEEAENPPPEQSRRTRERRRPGPEQRRAAT